MKNTEQKINTITPQKESTDLRAFSLSYFFISLNNIILLIKTELNLQINM